MQQAQYIAPRVHTEKMADHLEKVLKQYRRGLIGAKDFREVVNEIVGECNSHNV